MFTVVYDVENGPMQNAVGEIRLRDTHVRVTSAGNINLIYKYCTVITLLG
jgi:hypothetical protein